MSLRQPPCRGRRLRPGKAGSAASRETSPAGSRLALFVERRLVPYIRQPRAGSAKPLMAVLTSLFSLPSTLRR
ncbi:hypothetical protein EJP69_22220 [Variovorax gossypii]|uniref:Uncharacterized protein n=1 Tax=Variovorax gossypii TaxID=1679495 RepID=A0A3S0Q7L8_9BURK|nr:hypothetical protein EJP69_22220 [Variovorax gossypii]